MKFTTTIFLTILTALTAAAPLEPQTPPPYAIEVPYNTTAPEVTLVERKVQTGKMTYYTPGQGSCGKTNTENDLVVAISKGMYGTYANPNASPMCSKSASIKCNGKTIKAAIRDKCMSCGNADIDVSPAVFKQCGSLSTGVITVSWDVV